MHEPNPDISDITTVHCPLCGGYAPLVDFGADVFRKDGSQVWLFQCEDCGHDFGRTVES